MKPPPTGRSLTRIGGTLQYTSGTNKITVLLIDFKIIGTSVGDQPVAPTLFADLGAIRAGESRAVTFSMISSLQGKFVEYSAKFENMDGLGDPHVSLIDHVEIHELIHKVRADRPGDDAIPDFLANDLPDPNNLPDTFYSSAGSIEAVQLAGGMKVDAPAGPGHLKVQLTANMGPGWFYPRMPDPGPGLRLPSAISTGWSVPPGAMCSPPAPMGCLIWLATKVPARSRQLGT